MSDNLTSDVHLLYQQEMSFLRFQMLCGLHDSNAKLALKYL